MKITALTLIEIRESRFRQTFYRWLYRWTRNSEGEIFVEDNLSGDRFLWIPR